MWDLETIAREHNRVSLQAMMAGLGIDEAQFPLPENWALAVLAERLKVGPPLLTEIINCLENVEDVDTFRKLINTFLPGHEDEILSETRARRVYRFCYLFGQKYFKLDCNTDCGISNFIIGMPIEILAMSYSTYHELDMRIGYLLLLSLVVYPYEGDERDYNDDSVPFNPLNWLGDKKYKPSADDIAWLQSVLGPLAVGGKWIAPMGFSMVKLGENHIRLLQSDDDPTVKETIGRTLMVAKKAGIMAEFDTTGRTAEEKINGARIPLLEKVKQIVGEDLAGRVPGNGCHPAVLREMTEGTPYDGVGDFADWACSRTGCAVLDSSYDDCEYIEGNGEPVFKWSKRNVEILTKDAPKVQGIRAKIDRIVEWLETDPIARFDELLSFLLSKNISEAKKRKDAFRDPTEHWCPLDTLTENEEEEEGDNE